MTLTDREREEGREREREKERAKEQEAARAAPSSERETLSPFPEPCNPRDLPSPFAFRGY